METFLIKAAQLILAFVILVTIHELGHYIFARIYGMRVDRFYLFFNPWFSLAKYDPRKGTLQILAWTKKKKGKDAAGKDVVEEEIPRALATFRVGKSHPVEPGAKPTWRDTLYGLGWLPLGGYCSIAGMVDETTDAGQLAKDPEPWEFRAKKPFPRLMVMVAGVLFNFILAILIYIGIAWYWGDRVVQYDDTYEGFDFVEQLEKVGYKTGDIPLSVNGEALDAKDSQSMWSMLQDGATVCVLRNHTDTVSIVNPRGTLESLAKLETSAMAARFPVLIGDIVPGENAANADVRAGDRIVKVNNDSTPAFSDFTPALKKNAGKTVNLTILREGKLITANCDVNADGKIGVQMKPIDEIYPVEEVEYSFWQSIPKGINDGTDRLVTYVSSLKLLFTKSGAESLGGFGAIGNLYPDQWNWYSFWQITAFLSVILAFMNILPIPALDGGHVVFVLWEIITRRKPSIKVLEYAQMIGMAFLFLLLIYANANDIYRFFIK